MEELDILILGAGWTATFLIPLLEARKLSFAATTGDGREVAGSPTIPFRFDPSSKDQSSIASLPRARYILITFPLVGNGPSRLLVDTYTATHRQRSHAPSAADDDEEVHPSRKFRFIQLGSTGIWQGQQGKVREDGTNSPWQTRQSPFTETDKRAIAETELLSLGGCVLNLSGLWGGARDPRHWVDRVATTKEAVKSKKSLHMIHGVDVARAIAAVVASGDEKWASAGRGQRWMLTDGFVYDWWALFAGWAELQSVDGEEAVPTKQAQWVYELMVEEDVRALPRSMEQLERCYDVREFWKTFGLAPLKGRI
ncbi:hypothetical protein B0H63DRAFT_181853 [Podospora didyma]|uniref:Uncharacterized protein n=1 Tax=Podospora didyma TaxID=330526 RepID=A0AAE0TZM3_9PEZI|nr:hypothetical protein B0H63DRAFT_181853 [Podospora didyma]